MTELPLIGEAVAVAAHPRLAGAKIGVVTFPGTLDDRDAARAVRLAGATPVALWHADTTLGDVDAVVIPGGFSYGDYLRAGAIARFAPLMSKIIDAANSDAKLPVLGICNGFQILTESHLLPGSMIKNDHLKFMCRDQVLRVENNTTAWTGDYAAGQEITVPLKNQDGQYIADEKTLDALEAEGRVVFRYVGFNPNGSRRDIAGISNAAGNVVGLMPHPEHAVEAGFGPEDRRLRHRGPRLLHLCPEQDRGRQQMTETLQGATAETKKFNIDTVENAAKTPDTELPWAELGLKQNEFDEVVKVLGRRPTGAELAMYSVMWSEHCSYKSSKNHLRQFGDKVTEEMKKDMLVGIGENAGVTNLGDGWAVTFKIESHNSPSFVEPYQGAATGIGGIVRDIISMGARPVAVMDPLRFGAIDHPDTARVMHGAVAGIGGYGNSLGLPNIGGEMVFDSVYQGNPLVNALAVGVMRHEDIRLANASGKGNKVVLFGARTGGDGIGGASVLASESFDDTKPSKRPAVQVGDPFAEKVLIECCLELFKGSLVEGIQDLGAAGISCATSELASNGDGGMEVELTSVLLRDPTLTPGEILMSESQERMMAVVTPENIAAFEAVMDKWAVEYSWLGEVTDTGRLIITWEGEVIVDVDPRTVAHDGPVYDRPYARPEWQDAVQADSFTGSVQDAGRPSAPADLAAADHRARRLAEHVRQVLDHQPVRPLRRRQHRHGVPGRRRRGPGGRGNRPGRGPGHRRQRPLHLPRSVPRRAAGTGRGLPQRRHLRRRADGRQRLPELRLPRGSRRHVAAGRSHPRPVRRLHGARHPGHRRQRLAVQPDRHHPHPPLPRGGCAGQVRRRRPPHAVGLEGRRPGHLPAGHDGGGAGRFGMVQHARTPRRPAAQG